MTPQRVDSLGGISIKKVCCGAQFTVFLASDGRVFTCGLDRLIGQPENRMRGHNRPQQASFWPIAEILILNCLRG